MLHVEMVLIQPMMAVSPMGRKWGLPFISLLPGVISAILGVASSTSGCCWNNSVLCDCPAAQTFRTFLLQALGSHSPPPALLQGQNTEQELGQDLYRVLRSHAWVWVAVLQQLGPGQAWYGGCLSCFNFHLLPDLHTLCSHPGLGGLLRLRNDVLAYES